MKTTLTLIFLMALKSCSSPSYQKVDPNNLILVIGDGMGPGQISLLHYFLANTKLDHYQKTQNAFLKMNKGELGVSHTAPYGNIVVDSACSATQLATGLPSRSEMIGLDMNGNTVPTILEKAKSRGLSVGLVSDTRLTHATPASFAAHVANRWSEDQIAEEMLNAKVDVLLSGGINRFIPQGLTQKISHDVVAKSKRTDKKDLLELAQKNDYQLLFERNSLQRKTHHKKLLGLFTEQDYPNGIYFSKNEDNPKRKIPNLLEMTKTAIKHLSSNKKGFFLMVEAGQIDWAGHQNDAGLLLHEMLTINSTLNWIIDWVNDHPHTTLIVTADHETGGFGLGYNAFKRPRPIKLSGDQFKKVRFHPHYNYGEYSNLDRLALQKKSFREMAKEFWSLPKSQQTPSRIKKLIEDNTGFYVNLEKAKDILATEANPYYEKRNPRTPKRLPLIHHKREYYSDQFNSFTSLMAQAIAAQQNVVWGTSGHTASPVHVYSLGNKDNIKLFNGTLSHPEIGKKMQKILSL